MQDEQSKDADKECGRPRQTSLPRVVVGLALLVGLVVALPAAQPVFRGSEIFPPEEFAARRAKVMAQIGDGVAIVLGTPGPPGEMPFRQNSQFFYLTGVAEPRARAIIDGRTKKTTVFLQPKNDRRDSSMFGPALAPGDESAKALGVDAAVPDAEFTAAITASRTSVARSTRRLPPKCSAASRRATPRGSGLPTRPIRGTAATRAKRRSSPS